MHAAWSILALALFVTDGSPADEPRPPGPRLKVTFRIRDGSAATNPKRSAEAADEEDGCCTADEPDTCSGAVAEESQPKTWSLSLDEAIQIALDNSECVRVIAGRTPPSASASLRRHSRSADAAPMVISRVDEGDDAGEFESEAMALVRSVEQEYWNLYVAHVHFASANRACRVASEVIGKELAHVTCCRGSCADLAEAADHLDQLTDDEDRGASSVAEHEQRLRAILGLPPADNRRIVPCTEPVREWIAVGAKSVLKKENRASRKHKKGDIARPAARGSNDDLVQLVREFRTLYKSYQKAKKVAIAGEKKLDAQGRAYLEGKITAGRFLDFVRQYAASVTNEAGSLAMYNTALAALAEASGTLLTIRDIVIKDVPGALHASAAGKRDDALKPSAMETTTGIVVDEVPDIVVLPDLTPKPVDEPAKPESADRDGKTVIFSFTLGRHTCELSVGK